MNAAQLRDPDLLQVGAANGGAAAVVGMKAQQKPPPSQSDLGPEPPSLALGPSYLTGPQAQPHSSLQPGL